MCDIVEMSASASAGSDPRRFRFAIRCCRCDLPFHTTHDAREHFTFACPRRTWPKIRCGCCGTVYRNWGRCAAHLNVRGAHLRGPSSTIVVSSTTSSSEAESTSQEPSRRRHVGTQPPQVKEETEAVTSPPPADTGTPPPPKPFEVSASASVSPFSFAPSDISLSGGFDLSADNPLLQIVTTTDSGAGSSEGLSVTAVIPPPPPSSTTLQIGAAPRGSADLGVSVIILSPSTRSFGSKRLPRPRTSRQSCRLSSNWDDVLRSCRTGPLLRTFRFLSSRSPLRCFRTTHS